MKDLIKRLEDLAKKEAATDSSEFNPMDSSGANYDDCYYMGVEDGNILLAREILEEMKKVGLVVNMNKEFDPKE